MTVVPFQPQQPAPAAGVADRARGVLALLPDFIELAQRIADTEFVPTALRRRPEAVLAALMSGAERGLGPMESLRSVHVIEGRPTLSAEAMRALVLAAGHEIIIVESNAQRATLVGRRAGSQSTSPEFTWTLDRARRARLSNKRNWQEYPEAMLLARASTDLCRALFPDVVAGLAADEELDDELVPETNAPTTTRRASVSRLPAAAIASPEVTAGAAASRRASPAAAVTDDAPAGAADHRPSAAPAPELEEPAELDLGGIPGAEQPSWARTADPNKIHDPALARLIHAQITDAFPDVPNATRDRWRHAMVAVITRKRPEGPVISSSEITREEQRFVQDLLSRVRAGSTTIADGPDGTVELRSGGGWRYTVMFDPLAVDVRQGDVEPAMAAAELDPAPPNEEEPDG